MRVLIVGCGYVGLPLGKELVRQGHEVFGLRRSATARSALEAAGIKPVFADITKADELARLPLACDWVVNCVASGGGGADDYRRVYFEGTRNLLDWLRNCPPRKYVYTSSTSVYGQRDGSLVDESSPTYPSTTTGRILLQTEQALLEAVRLQDFPALILRLAGIYGPDRGYWFKQFLKGEARIQGKGERWLNMIHRDDVAGCIMAALERGKPGEIYNAVDDEPVSQRRFFEWLASTLGRDLPPAMPEEAGRVPKRGMTNKRVSNRKLKTELGYPFKHPTFRQGYASEIRRLHDADAPRDA